MKSLFFLSCLGFASLFFISCDSFKSNRSAKTGDELIDKLRQPKIALGTSHTCALLSNDKIKCWGKNEYGQLGLGDIDNRGDAANEMGDDLPFVDLGTYDHDDNTNTDKIALKAKQISLGWHHTCALLSNDKVKCWGHNTSGQLGLGDTDNRGDAVDQMGDNLPFVDLGDFTVKQIALGGQHTCALLSNDKIKCWGDNLVGELGLGDTDNRGDAVDQMGDNLPFVDLGTYDHDDDSNTAKIALKTKQISLGSSHTCALLNNDKIKCWGNGGNGRLGLGDTKSRGDAARRIGDNLPFVDLGTYNHDGNVNTAKIPLTAKQISLGSFHTCALLSNNKIKCWGFNGNGRLGFGDTNSRGDEADQMGNNLPFVDLGIYDAKYIALGSHHTCALLSNDKIKCWGSNSHGRLGLGNINSRGDEADQMGNNLPFVDLGIYDAKYIALGSHHTCALLSNDKIKCWGSNSHGRLGLGNINSRGDEADQMGNNLPFVDLGNFTVKQTSLGWGYTCALLSNDKIKCWGFNDSGQLGLEDTDNRGDEADEMGTDLPFVDLGI